MLLRAVFRSIPSPPLNVFIPVKLETLFAYRKEFIVVWVPPVVVAIATGKRPLCSDSSPPLFGSSLTPATSLNPTSMCVRVVCRVFTVPRVDKSYTSVCLSEFGPYRLLRILAELRINYRMHLVIGLLKI